MRQLAETKDSLHFSNHLCEQQELKVDELEKSNNRLRKLCNERQNLLEQKNSKLVEIEENVICVRDENDRIKAKLENIRTSGGDGGGAVKHENGRSHSLTITTSSNKEESEELAQLKEAYSELTVKLQNSMFQKKRLERQLEEVISENLSLTTTAERTEIDYAELQQKIEELSKESSETSPISLNTTFSAPRIDSRLPSLSESAADMPFENAKGESLFSELGGTQYSSLHHHNCGDFLQQKCTCSGAGVVLHKRSGGNRRGDTTDYSPSRESKSFKELFDEMFATLRQTAEVADRLIENGGK